MESGLANVVEPYQHSWGIRIPFSFFYSRPVFFPHIFSYPIPLLFFLTFHFVRNLLIFIFSNIRAIHSLGCQCWALGMHDGFVSLRLSRTPPVLSILSRLCTLSPTLPLLSLLASATPLPPSLSLSLSPLLARLIDPDPVLFSSLFDSRRVTRAPTHPPPHDGKGCLESEKGCGRVEEEARGCVGGTGGGTGPTHRSRDIHFHFIFLARYRRQRKKERKEEAAHSREGVRKNFGRYPESVDRLDSLSGSRESEFAIFATT